MINSLRGVSVVAAVLAITGQGQGWGGFWLTLGNPDASSEARALHAAVTVKPVGCTGAAKDARISGQAIGIVKGNRQSIPLKMIAMQEPGMFAVAKQWPDQGRWIVQFVGRSGAAVTTTLAVAGPDGVDRYSAKNIPGEVSEAQIGAILNQARMVARK